MHVSEKTCFLNKFFPIHTLVAKIIFWQSCAMVPRWWIFGDFLLPAAICPPHVLTICWTSAH